VAFVLNADGFRASLPWHLLLLTNVYFVVEPGHGPWPVSQFWIFSILAQFYLVWPLVMLGLPARWRLWVTLLAILAISLVRVFADSIPISTAWADWALAIDPILAGAAACQLQQSALFRKILCDRGLAELSVLALALPLMLGPDFAATETYRLLGDAAMAVLVTGAFHGFSGSIGAVLQSAPARFLGRISFAAYAYYMLVWYILGTLNPALFSKGPATFAVLAVTTLCLATLSWYAMEAPMNRLKRFFPVVEPVPPAQP
jgi:peptidoglycan/LPS O-acetylase OafA/YrhL